MNLCNIPKGYVVSEHISLSIDKKSIQIIVPQEISNHPILVRNIKELPVLAWQFIECKKVYLTNLKIVDDLFFDSEKEKYRKKMAETIKEEIKLEDLMNDGISPYKWNVYEDGNNIVCFLEKNRKRDDE